MHLISYDNNSISTIFQVLSKKNGYGVIRVGEKIIQIERERERERRKNSVKVKVAKVTDYSC